MDWQYLVRLFMTDVKGLTLPRQPTIPDDPATPALCSSLMFEELNELQMAMNEEDMVEIADGIADLLYVTLYTANAYGIYIDPIFKEVQRSNMTKVGGLKREDGKQLKPAGYEPPNIEPLLRAQQRYTPVAYNQDGSEVMAYLDNESGRIVGRNAAGRYYEVGR